MKIKVVCERTGLTDRTIRYYIEEELLSPSFKENYIGRKSFDFTEENIEELNNIAVLRSFDFSIEEIRQILKDPSSSPSIIKAVKHRVSGELTTNQKKESLLSSLHEQTAYTVCDLAKQLSTPAEITSGEKKNKSKRTLRMAIVSAAGLLLFIGVLIFVFAFCNKTCEHRDADDNALCDACEEAFADAVEHAIDFKTLVVNDTTAHVKVSSSITSFSFLDEVSVLGGATFEVFRDIECKQPIKSKDPELAIGDNIFYVLEYVGGERRNLYTVTVRRKPMYAVTFDTEGGTAITSQLVEEGAFIVAPNSPAKSGYFFAGWSSDLTLPVTGDITVKANWTNKPYTVIYDANGGTVDATSVSITYAQSYTLKTPQRLGYSFDGWYYGEDKIELTGVWEIAEDVTLTASWTPHTNTPYKVEHYVEKLDGTYELRETVNLTGTSDATVTPIPKSYAGFTAPTRQTITVLPDGTSLVRYEYKRNSYTVTFVTNGGERVATQALKHGVSLSHVTRAGYTFGGWFSDVDLATAVTIVPAQNITVYAWWVEETKAGSFKYSGTDEITITDFKASDVDVCIPAFIGGKPVTRIDEYAFVYGSKLVSITLPVTVTDISSAVFQKCSNIALITVKQGNAVYHSRGNCLIETATNTLVFGCKNSMIPDYVTSIGDRAFSNCSSLTSITIPNGVTSIGNYAFANCNKLTSITLPNGVTGIGDHVFSNCYRLESIAIPDGVTDIGEYAFYSCLDLKLITFSEGLISIGKSAFYNCVDLTSIELPTSLKSIGQSAFCCCYGLESITIPAGVTSIADDTFSNCFDLASVTIADSVKSIGKYAFGNCSSLVSITLPDSVINIGNGAFSGCYDLTSIILPTGLTSIGASMFSDCDSLKSITLPDSVTRIGNSAFSASGLRSITLPAGVMSIGAWAFESCSSLTSISLPDSLTSIGNFAFAYSSSLTSITIPDSVTSIGHDVFTGCDSLTSITIPLWYLPECIECFSLKSDMYFCCLYEYDGVGKPAGLSDLEKTQQFGGWYADVELTTPFDFDAWLAGERVVGDTLTLYTKFSAS